MPRRAGSSRSFRVCSKSQCNPESHADVWVPRDKRVFFIFCRVLLAAQSDWKLFSGSVLSALSFFFCCLLRLQRRRHARNAAACWMCNNHHHHRAHYTSSSSVADEHNYRRHLNFFSSSVPLRSEVDRRSAWSSHCRWTNSRALYTWETSSRRVITSRRNQRYCKRIRRTFIWPSRLLATQWCNFCAAVLAARTELGSERLEYPILALT